MEIILRREKRRRAYTAPYAWKALAVSVVLLGMMCSTETEIDDDGWIIIPNNIPQNMKDINQPNSDSNGECRKENNSECNDKSDIESNEGQKKEHEQECKMANPMKHQGYSGKKQNKITKDCPIVLDILSDTKRAVLSQTENNTYSYIELFETPIIQEINTRDTSSSTIVVDDLWIDKQTFINLITEYTISSKKDGAKYKEDKSVRQVLVVENLHLYEMPYTFTETHDILSPWIKAKNVTIYIEHCDKCSILIENIVPEKYIKANLANIGIYCENDPVYKSLTDSIILKDKTRCSKNPVELEE
ncbi:hypothetical protein NEFER03_2246 [Nematocida sp. LUAm3]|nr:hypothetical protein NEFER03_2246 [Nematocida sp. LUAm3]KAI5174805.1 hypothetical protein NEFER02_0915 [Nematocida sp. LUAm2]KAI5179345.1 hypothetical protein NEFER01_2187 [Nematocida sp. LUAm1]KAI5179397.1 hypothetical protein NEFER01_2223 [Nematocida sp. LUAm1]